jgi:hypothetical protein
MALKELGEFLQGPHDNGSLLLECVIVTLGDGVFAGGVCDRVFVTVGVELEEHCACAKL